VNTSEKILFVRFRKPFAIKDGGEYLTQKNYDVFCEIFGKQNIEEYYIHPDLTHETIWNKIQKLPYIFANYYFGLTPRKARQICKIAENKDIVFIDRSIFGILAKHLKRSGFSGKIITFFQNSEVVYYQTRYPKHIPFRSFLLRCINRNDAYAMRYSDITVCLNRRDDDELLKRYGKRTNAVIPITVDDKFCRDVACNVSTENPPTALFLGSYMPANVDGILWFIENVLPHVDIRLQVVGKGVSKLKNHVETRHALSLQKTKIEIFSDVEDVSPFFEHADFVISPIFKGSGMKVKTCEALMYGKTIIGTTESFEGYAVDFEKIGALANTKDEFIVAIQEISLKNNGKFNTYAREYFLQHHSSEVAKKIFEKLLRP